MSKIIFLILQVQLIFCVDHLDICGQSPFNNSIAWRIINGHDAHVGEFPWHVLITLRAGAYANDTEPNFCSGTLINDQWVLTAGHCLKEYGKFDVEADVLSARLGVHNMSIVEDLEVDVTVERVVLRLNYSVTDFKYEKDIALLKLNERLDFEGKHKHLRPICLTKNDTELTRKCVAIGFGMTGLSM